MSHLIKKPRSVKKDTEPYLPYFDCVLPLYFMGEGGGADSIHPLFRCETNRKSKIRAWSPLDHTLRHHWILLVWAAKNFVERWI